MPHDLPPAPPSLREYLAMPQVQAMLAAIRHVETGDGPDSYRTFHGGGLFDDLSRHPNKAHNGSTAAGRYQFLGRTWKALAREHGFEDFGPENQDLGAVALILGKKGAMDAVLAGDYAGAARLLSGTWTGLRRYGGGGLDIGRHLGGGEASGGAAGPGLLDPGLALAGQDDWLSELGLAIRGDAPPDIDPVPGGLGIRPLVPPPAMGRIPGPTYGQGRGLPGDVAPSPWFQGLAPVSQAGVPGLAVAETAEDLAALDRLGGFPPELAGGALLARRELARGRDDEARALRAPMPDLNDLDLLNIIDQTKV
jgi:muramidase (phage lysozyme)